MVPNSRLAVLIGAVFSALFTSVAAIAAEGPGSGVTIDPPRQISSHTLTDQNGQSQNFPSRQWQLVFFGFTHCPDMCPITMHKAAQVIEKLKGSSTKLTVTFITIDPERDKPEALREFLGHHGSGMQGLTGTLNDIQAVGKDFEIVVRRYQDRDTGAPRFEHSAFLYLLDTKGQMVMFYPATADARAMANNIQRLMSAAK